jgi:hypothetical protein
MVGLAFATSIEVYSTSEIYLSLVTGLDVIQNISTEEVLAVRHKYKENFKLR